MSPYNPPHQSPATLLMITLQNEQAELEQDLPKGCKIAATITLTTGEQFKIVSAYATEPNLIVFIGLRDNKSVRLVVRYELFAYCTFTVVKGKQQRLGFSPIGPSSSPSASLSPSASPSPSV